MGAGGTACSAYGGRNSPNSIARLAVISDGLPSPYETYPLTLRQVNAGKSVRLVENVVQSEQMKRDTMKELPNWLLVAFFWYGIDLEIWYCGKLADSHQI